jgi:hypothetical protein
MAEDPAVAQLRKALDAEPPKALMSQLPDAQVIALADAVTRARRAQLDALRSAADHAFDHIPRLLRGPVRKIVGV